MANKKVYKKSVSNKIDNSSTNFSLEVGKFLKVLIGVFVFFVVFYFFTIYLLNRETPTVIKETEPLEATIQYQEILAGNSFSMDDDHYIVIYYDMSDDTLKSAYTSIISSYEDSDNHYPVYIVDMSKSFNKKYFSKDGSNKQVESIDELKISSTTLIEFQSGQVKNYLENEEAIKEFLQ